MLRSTMLALVLGLAPALAACGDGGDDPPRDAGRDRVMPPDGPTNPDGSTGPDGSTNPDGGTSPDGSSGTDGGAGGMCPAGACDLVSNAGCGAGEACYFVRTSMDAPAAPTCLPAGTAGDGDPCTNANDCREGFACDGRDGICRAVCCGGDDMQCPTGQRCIINIVDDAGNPQGWGMCKAPDECDLLMQTGCPEGQACYPGGGDGSVLCAPPTMVNGGDGDSCSALNDCRGGFVCVTPAGGESICRQLCDTTAGDSACPSGRRCVNVTSFPTGIGVCAAAG